MMVADGAGMIRAPARKANERVVRGHRMPGGCIGRGNGKHTRYGEAVVARRVGRDTRGYGEET